MLDEILSSLSAAATSRFIYSSLSFYAPRRGGTLSGPWFTTALGALGVDESAIRQTLYRMERDGAVVAKKLGRLKTYSATPTTRAVIEAGTAKLLQPAERAWDHAWTLVRFQFDAESRAVRDRVRDVLMVEGFAALGPGLYIHPRDRSARIREAIARLGHADRLYVFRGPRIDRRDDMRLALELWDLASVAARYRRFLARFGPLADRPPAAITPTPRDAMALRFALVFAYLEVAWDDPELPTELLPGDWPGHEARTLARTLYRRLLPAAVAFSDRVWEAVHPPPPRRRARRKAAAR